MASQKTLAAADRAAIAADHSQKMIGIESSARDALDRSTNTLAVARAAAKRSRKNWMAARAASLRAAASAEKAQAWAEWTAAADRAEETAASAWTAEETAASAI